MKKKNFFAREYEDYQVLLRNVPGLWLVFYCLAVVLMNILANRELINFKYLALDCGFTLSWLVFLCDDVLTKRFGTKASVKLTILALFINLCVSGLFFILSNLPWGHWSQYYTYDNVIIDDALNATLGGTWYVLLGSTIACLISSLVNSLINTGIGRIFERKHIDNFRAFAARSYVSTGVGQFVDNFLFACIVSYVFFSWTALQVIMCSLTGMAFELLAEIILSPIGYRICKNWEKNNVGIEYIYYSRRQKGKK